MSDFMAIKVRPGYEAMAEGWEADKRQRGFTGRVKVRSGKKVPANVPDACRTVNRNRDLYAWLCDAFYAGQVTSFNVTGHDEWMVGGATFTTADLRRFATEDNEVAA